MYNSIYPAYAGYYSGLNNRQITRKQGDEKSSQSSHSAQEEVQERRHQTSDKGAYFPNGEKVAIDYTKRQINIEQVLTDFKNTANAIGAPEDIKSEVLSYLDLINSQAQKDNPNQQIIQSNLKNASQILDEYITNTLKKPSKVVENWVDALFLQKIDYKIPVKETQEISNVNAAADENTQAVQTVPSEIPQRSVQAQNTFYVPDDPALKRMFIQAKKYAAIDSKEKALSAFGNSLDYAMEIGDNQTQAIIHYEQGRLYDEFNEVEDALFNYDRAAKQSNDNNIKARAHFSMGKIYDDYVKFEPAVSHYCAAVSFAGEADNLKLQTQALSDLAQIHAGRYDKENTLMFMDMADTIASETKDSRVKGIISSKNANCCQKIDENTRALRYYGESAYSFMQTDDNEKLAKNYVSAAQIMSEYGNKAKAKKLLSKAYIAAQKTDNSELKMQITRQIADYNV